MTQSGTLSRAPLFEARESAVKNRDAPRRALLFLARFTQGRGPLRDRKHLFLKMLALAIEPLQRRTDCHRRDHLTVRPENRR